jgi:hypothetical protein
VAVLPLGQKVIVQILFRRIAGFIVLTRHFQFNTHEDGTQKNLLLIRMSGLLIHILVPAL